MAHNIATIGGRVAMAYQGETPWHGLGTRIQAGTSVAEALEVAALNWSVDLRKIFLEGHIEIPGQRAVVRDLDTQVLGIVGADYKPIQNPDAFNQFQPAIDEFGLTIEAAGALGKGEKLWMLFRMPDSVEPVPGDRVQGYLVGVTSHNGSHAFFAQATPIRVVCQNTLTAAVGDGYKTSSEKGRIFTVQHMGDNVKDQIAQAGRMVKSVTAALKQTGETFAQLAARQMTPAEVVAYIETVFPSGPKGEVSEPLANRRAQVAELVWSGVGAQLAGSNESGTTAWAAYNAVTEYFDHVRPAESKSEGGLKRANQSALFGQGASIKLDALRAARELVAA